MGMTSNRIAGSDEQRAGALDGVTDVVGIHSTALEGSAGRLKRVEDLVLGSLILAFMALPMLVIAIAIKVSSGSPICFRQRRYGLDGKPIRTLRFRTTSVCVAATRGGEARTSDSRVTTWLGRFLRRTSLDEAPQLLQVITGELSLVGPCPHATEQEEEYRHLVMGRPLPPVVKPGITSWAYVNSWHGPSEAPDRMQQRLAYDLEYLRDWSLLWDLKIIFLSIFGTKKRQHVG
jgi:putative colanic acid biosynthesis UDP-glucose lipid carrier transferase